MLIHLASGSGYVVFCLALFGLHVLFVVFFGVFFPLITRGLRRGGRDGHVEARRAKTTPNGGPHVEVERLRLKTLS